MGGRLTAQVEVAVEVVEGSVESVHAGRKFLHTHRGAAWTRVPAGASPAGREKVQPWGGGFGCSPL